MLTGMTQHTTATSYKYTQSHVSTKRIDEETRKKKNQRKK